MQPALTPNPTVAAESFIIIAAVRVALVLNLRSGWSRGVLNLECWNQYCRCDYYGTALVKCNAAGTCQPKQRYYFADLRPLTAVSLASGISGFSTTEIDRTFLLQLTGAVLFTAYLP